jgi:hypothetical protein
MYLYSSQIKWDYKQKKEEEREYTERKFRYSSEDELLSSILQNSIFRYHTLTIISILEAIRTLLSKIRWKKSQRRFHERDICGNAGRTIRKERWNILNCIISNDEENKCPVCDSPWLQLILGNIWQWAKPIFPLTERSSETISFSLITGTHIIIPSIFSFLLALLSFLNQSRAPSPELSSFINQRLCFWWSNFWVLPFSTTSHTTILSSQSLCSTPNPGWTNLAYSSQTSICNKQTHQSLKYVVEYYT